MKNDENFQKTVTLLKENFIIFIHPLDDNGLFLKIFNKFIEP